MKIIKNLIIICALTVFLLNIQMPLTAFGLEYYDTNEYNVNMDVNKDNSFMISEEIKVTFSEPRHGIYRYIPLSGTAYSEYEGIKTELKYKMKIDMVSVEGYEVNTYEENGNLVIQIGSGDYYVDGDQAYKLSYRVRLYDDGIDEYDSIYYNIIPFGWGTPINKASITVSMPDSFNSENVEFISGVYGSTDVDSIKWNTSGNTIVGETINPMPLGAGVTYRVILPEGYFVDEMNTNWALAILILIIIGAPLVSFFLWSLFGRDPRVVKTVEFYPPEEISPAEVGYIVDGIVDPKDLISLVIYFAEKGLLTIQELEDDEFLLIKNMEISNAYKSYESSFFNGLFYQRDSVTLSELKGTFYPTYQNSSALLRNYYKKNKATRIFTHSSLGARALGILLMMLPVFAVILLGPIYAMLPSEYSILGIPITVLTAGGYALAIYAHDKRDATSMLKFKATFIGGIIMMGIGLLMLAGFSIFFIGLTIGALALVSSVISFSFTMKMKQRTKKSAELLGKILGFKEFIRTAELDRIKKLCDENPEYFYNVLPYAYVLGLNEKWAKKFEGIEIEPPNWYNSRSNTLFNTWIFMNMFNGFTNNMRTSMMPPTPKSGSGGFGSGGFSGGGGFGGGGFGGGGGGSW